MKANYFYLDGANSVCGPHQKEDLVELRGKGVLNDKTLVAKEGDDEWISYTNISSDFYQLPPVPPSPPAAASAEGLDTVLNFSEVDLGDIFEGVSKSELFAFKERVKVLKWTTHDLPQSFSNHHLNQEQQEWFNNESNRYIYALSAYIVGDLQEVEDDKSEKVLEFFNGAFEELREYLPFLLDVEPHSLKDRYRWSKTEVIDAPQFVEWISSFADIKTVILMQVWLVVLRDYLYSLLTMTSVYINETSGWQKSMTEVDRILYLLSESINSAVSTHIFEDEPNFSDQISPDLFFFKTDIYHTLISLRK